MDDAADMDDLVAELAGPVSPRRFGEIVGLDETAVLALRAVGVLAEGGTGLDWVRAYCANLRALGRYKPPRRGARYAPGLGACSMTRLRALLETPATQEEVAAMLGVSAARVSQLITEGALPREASAIAALDAYLGRLRDTAAGRDHDGSVSRERARLLREQADEAARRNQVARGEVAHIGVLETVLSHVARQLATRLDALVPQIKRREPDLPARVLTLIAAEIQACREACASVRLGDAERLDREGLEEEEAP